MPPLSHQSTDEQAWKKKAMAFTVRSHRHLWGKNNEDPLCFLFKQDLSNTFLKELYLGWNKFSQERPCENWGLSRKPDRTKTFILPAGIVIPVIEDKNLVSIFIQTYKDFKPGKLFVVPGSMKATYLLADKPQNTVIIIDHLMDGLFLFQEKRNLSNVLIHLNTDTGFDGNNSNALLGQVENVLFITRNKRKSDPIALNKTTVSPVYYNSRDELISIAAGG